MRKLLAIIVAIFLVMAVASCGDTDTPSSSATSVPTDTTTAVGMTETTANPSSSSTTPSSLPSDTTATGEMTTAKPSDKVTTTVTTTKATSVTPVGPVEKPVTYNTAILYNKQSSSYDAQAETMRQSILNLKDTVKAASGKTTYYVSPTGNDNADGKSPATAWRTPARIDKATLQSGDAVLFARGGVYRGKFTLRSGVSYGAYGSGPKPAIYGSPRNYADASLWKKSSAANVWQLDVSDLTGDIGNIIFDHGVECASPGKRLSNKLTKDFQFYHDKTKGIIYLYLSKGNPGSVYKDIEVAPYGMILGGLMNMSDITIENLCIKYGGCHGIQFKTGAKNITIRGCEIGYMGGSMQGDLKVRFGNGIEILNQCNNILLENNWVYQCYDAGLTHQAGTSQGAGVYGFTMRNNLVEYCPYNIEYFFGGSNGYNDVLFEGNVLRFAGYGFGTEGRIGSDDSRVGAINGWNDPIPSKNFVIRNNVLDTSYRYLMVAPYTDGVKGPKMEGNTWIQHKDTKSAVGYMYDEGLTGADRVAPKTLAAGSLATMKTSVAVMDATAKSVLFEN